MRTRRGYAVALVLQLIGGAALVSTATREWQTVRTARPRPFADDVLGLSGRTLDGAPTALGLVALAGVVAVIATSGHVRRAVGALVALAGLVAVWRCALALPAVDRSAGQGYVRDAHPQVAVGAPLDTSVAAHPVWAAVAIAGALLVLAAGTLVAVHGGAWYALSRRYERAGTGDAPGSPVRPDDPADDGTDAEQRRVRAEAALWNALERGEDPTAADDGPRPDPPPARPRRTRRRRPDRAG